MSDNKKKRVLIVAGEASADLHGSNLVRAIKKMDPGLSIWGVGGEKMKAAGVKILIPSSAMAVVGLTEVFSKLHRISKAYFQLKSILKRKDTDLLILLDYPDFNINLARSAKRFGIPVLYYISPQVWAWRKGRVKKIADRVDRMAVILPFEKPFYKKHGLSVEYVGHPLLDAAPIRPNRNDAIRELGLENADPVLGLLPGSRTDEVINLLPVMIKASSLLSSRYPALKCVLPLASTISPGLVRSIIGESSLDIKISRQGIYQSLAACDMAVVASGTATLEAAIMGIPMVIAYRVSPISYWVGKIMVRVPHIGLVNLVAGEEIVPELIQGEVTPERIAEEALTILMAGQRRENMIKKLGEVKEKLGEGGASERTAGMAIEMINPNVA